MTGLALKDSLEIATSRVRHAALLSDYYQRNAQRFRPWHPAVRSDHHSFSSWTLRLKEREQLHALGQYVHFILLDGPHLAATCSLTEINSSLKGSAVVGYSVDGSYEGQGYMSLLLGYVIEYAFGQLQLEQIRASYMPANTRSARLLEKLGFEKIGHVEKFLYIHNHWEDHIMTSLESSRWSALKEGV